MRQTFRILINFLELELDHCTVKTFFQFQRKHFNMVWVFSAKWLALTESVALRVYLTAWLVFLVLLDSSVVLTAPVLDTSLQRDGSNRQQPSRTRNVQIARCLAGACVRRGEQERRQKNTGKNLAPTSTSLNPQQPNSNRNLLVSRSGQQRIADITPPTAHSPFLGLKDSFVVPLTQTITTTSSSNRSSHNNNSTSSSSTTTSSS
eukprot:scpid93980/ scgid34331/ 